MVEEISTSGECSTNLSESHKPNASTSEDIHDDEVCTRNLCIYCSFIYLEYTKLHGKFISCYIR